MLNKIQRSRLSALLAILIALAILLPNLITPQVRAAGLPTFIEETDAAGLYHRNETWGWTWGDYDEDGWLDLFLGNHPEQGAPASDPPLPSYLMHNNRNGTFSNVLDGSGILPHEDRHDQAWIDYDDDGDLDLWALIGARGGSGVPAPKQLYRQGPTGQFTDVAGQAGVDYPLARGRGSAWLDYDLDGDLDLYLTSAITDQASNAFFRNNGDGTFTNIAAQLNLDPYLGEVTNASVADYDNDGDPDMYVTDRVRLYRNAGTQFSAVQSTAGVNTSVANTAVWGDYDNDGDLDLFVTRGRTGDGDHWEMMGNEIRFVGRSEANEDGLDITVSGSASLTFHLQEREGGFVSRDPNIIFLGPDGSHPSSNPFTLNYGLVSGPPAYTPASSEGFFIWQSAPGQYHIRWTAPSGTLIRMSGIITTDTSFTNITEVLWEPETTSPNPDRLFRNNGNGTFTEVGAAAGVANGLDNKGATSGDFDNDGFLDLFVQSQGTMGTNYPNLLYHNSGDGTFTEVAAQVGVAGVRTGAGWGALWADYDNDGFLDLLTSQATWPWPIDTGSYELFRNQGNGNHWLKVNLSGVQSNSRGYGAKVWVTAGGMTQFREVSDSSHYFNHYSGPVHFGLGSTTIVDEVRVKWPTGAVDLIQNVAADRVVSVVEGGSPSVPTPTFTPTSTVPPTETIVDNLDPGFTTTGFWNTNTSSQYPSYNGNFRYATAGTGTRQATFRPSVVTAGDYEVFIWYLSNTAFGTNTPYTINYNGGSTGILVNHRAAMGGGYWYSLGVYPFAAGTTGSIVVSDNADGTVPADAVRLLPSGSPIDTPTPTNTPRPALTPTPTPTPSETPTSPPSGTLLYVSFTNNGPYTVSAVTGVADDDILSFDGSNFAMFFDGSDVGLGSLDLDAFYSMDADTLLISFNSSATIASLGTVDDSDIVRFDATSLGTTTAGTFSMFFDGSLFGLDTDDEDVDAIELLPDGRLLISTFGTASIPGLSGTQQDEDLLAFTPSTPGDYSSGTWTVYFDGSDVSLGTNSGEDIDGMDVAANGDIYLTTFGSFAVSGVSGADEDIFVCGSPVTGPNSACTFSSTLFFDGSLWGLGSNDVDAVALP